MTPVQFNPNSAEIGDLRRFTSMVFQISYLDPRNANLALIQDTMAPVVDNISIEPQNLGMLLSIDAHDVGADGQGAGEGIAEIVVLASFDDMSWQRYVLKYNPTTQHYEARLINRLSQSVPALIIKLSDNAGNTSFHSLKGDTPVSYTHLDVYKRQVLNGPCRNTRNAMLGSCW